MVDTMIELLHSPVERAQTVQDSIWYGLRGTVVSLTDGREDMSAASRPDGLAEAGMADQPVHRHS
jgi:hypothetical protein